MRASLLSAALVAALVGFGSTIALVLAAAAAVGATPEQDLVTRLTGNATVLDEQPASENAAATAPTTRARTERTITTEPGVPTSGVMVSSGWTMSIRAVVVLLAADGSAVATFAVGLLPGYAVLGIWAAVLLVGSQV